MGKELLLEYCHLKETLRAAKNVYKQLNEMNNSGEVARWELDVHIQKLAKRRAFIGHRLKKLATRRR